jgi:hypothetical protein
VVPIERTVLEFLQADTALAAVVGDRIYADSSLPSGYKPSQGAAILLAVRGGGQDYTSKVLRASIQFRCYGADAPKARACDRALYAALNDKHGPGIKQARLETLGQLVSEPSTGWRYVVSFYQVRLTNP